MSVRLINRNKIEMEKKGASININDTKLLTIVFFNPLSIMMPSIKAG